jgi:hypothetical protein
MRFMDTVSVSKGIYWYGSLINYNHSEPADEFYWQTSFHLDSLKNFEESN